MFAPTFTYEQIYDIYCAGFHPTRRLIEDLLATLADWEQTLDVRRRQAVEGLAATVRRLQTQLARTKEKLVRKDCEVYALTRRVQELQAELARRDAQAGREALAASLGIPPPVRRDSHNSSLPPSSDLPRAKAKNAAVRRTRSLRKKSGRRPGGQPGRRGATLRQVEYPDRLRMHDPYYCRGCGASLDDCAVVGRRRRQVFDLPQPVVEVTEHWAQTKRCDACGERTTARFPRDVRAPAQYGVRARAVASYLHKYQLVPFARTAEAMKDLFGCAISAGTVEATRRRAKALLVGAEEQIKAGIRAAEVIGADETGLRVAGKSYWVHVARTDGLTHYGADARRGRAATDAIGILPTFTGVCVHDGWRTYDEYGGATHALCNVHILRELVYIEEVCAEQQRWTRPLAKLLLDIKAAVEAAKARGETKLGDDLLARYTARYDRLVKRAARINPPLKEQKPDEVAKRYKVVKVKRRDPARPLIRRLQDKREQVLRFMTDFRVAFDNNGSERDIRMVKLQQKIGGCFRTEEGAQAFCRIRSYLSSARKQGHSTLTALERAFAGKPLDLNS